jgi:predicted DCC family thiol-disulfide oxidoreductase YuxK
VLTLHVLYDADCDLCCRVRAWLEAQPKYVDLAFAAAGSAEARGRFPLLDHQVTLKEFTVVSSGGLVYRGAKAWLMCLWALREYRGWSLRLGSAELMPIARRVIAWASGNRFRFNRYSAWVGRG